MLNLSAVHNALFLSRPTVYLRYATAGIFVKGDVEFLDKVISALLYVERIVLCIVLARLGAVVTELIDIVVSDHISVLFGRIFLLCASLDLGIEVVSVLVAKVKKPSHVVDSRYRLVTSFKLVLHAESLEKSVRADLDAVAETDGLDLGVSLHIARDNAHRVRIVEKPSVRAYLFDVGGKVLHDLDGPHTAHYSAYSERVGYSLTETVLFRYFKVDDRAGIVQTDLDRIDNEIRASESVLPLFNSEILFNGGSALVNGVIHRGDENVGLLKSVRVNVVKCYFNVVEGFAEHRVSKHVFGEHGASRTHKCDLHASFSFQSKKLQGIILNYHLILYHLFFKKSIALCNLNVL